MGQCIAVEGERRLRPRQMAARAGGRSSLRLWRSQEARCTEESRPGDWRGQMGRSMGRQVRESALRLTGTTMRE